LNKFIPVPDIILELVPKVEEPNVPGLLNVLFPVFPNKLPGFCCPNNEEPPPKLKPVFVPIHNIHMYIYIYIYIYVYIYIYTISHYIYID